MSHLKNTVLRPLEVEKFLATDWEKSFRHISRGDAGHFADLISVSAIETYLATQDAYFPSVQVVHNMRDISRFDYTDDVQRINPRALAEHYLNGATLIVSDAHKKFPALASLCREFTQSLQMRCQTNLYLSPSDNQGFRSHYDTHDVFILQVQGSKTFRFYESDVALPFPDDQYDPGQNPHNTIEHEVTVNAGDTLYIPRGLVHDAVAKSADPSLHVTLGVFPVVLRDILQSAVHIVAERNVALREATMPSQPHKSPSVQELKRLLSEYLTQDIVDEAYDRAMDELAYEVAPGCDTLLESPPLSDESVLSIKHSAVLGTEYRHDLYKLRLFGQVVSFNEPMANAMDYLFNSEQIRMRELPELDQDQRLALCHHLLKANVLNVHM